MKRYNVTVMDLWQDKETIVSVLAYSENQARHNVLTNASAFRYIIRSVIEINQPNRVA